MMKVLYLMLYALSAMQFIHGSTYCDFKKIFQTPVDTSRFDNYEILERANFGDDAKHPGQSDCDSNLPKAFANAQVLVHVQNDKSICKESCNKPAPCHFPYSYPHYPYPYPLPPYNPYIAPYPLYPYNYNPFSAFPYPNFPHFPNFPHPIESKLVLDKPLVVLDEDPQRAVQLDDVFEIPCDTVIKTCECEDTKIDEDCYDEEKIIEDIMNYEGSGCKPLDTSECDVSSEESEDCLEEKIVICDAPIKAPIPSCLPKDCDEDEHLATVIYCPDCKRSCDKPFCPNCQKVIKQPCELEEPVHDDCCPYCKKVGVTNKYCPHCKKTIQDSCEDKPVIIEHDCHPQKIVIDDLSIKVPIASCLPKECDEDEHLHPVIYCPDCKTSCDKPFCPICQQVIKQPCELEEPVHDDCCPYCKKDGVTNKYCPHCKKTIQDPCEDKPVIIEHDCHDQKIVIDDKEAFKLEEHVHEHCCPYCKKDGVTNHYCSHCKRVIKEPCEVPQQPCDKEDDKRPCGIKDHSACTILVDPKAGPPCSGCVLINADLIDLDKMPTLELSDILERENLRKCQQGTKKRYRCQNCGTERPIPPKHEKPVVKTDDGTCDSEDDDLPGVLVDDDDDDDGKYPVFIYDPNLNTDDEVKEITLEELEKATFLADAAAAGDLKEITVDNTCGQVDDVVVETQYIVPEEDITTFLSNLKPKKKKDDGKYYFVDGSKLGDNPYGCSCCSGCTNKPFKYDIDDLLNVKAKPKCNQMEVLLPKPTPAIDPLCVEESDEDSVVDFVYRYPHSAVPSYPVISGAPSLTDKLLCLDCDHNPCCSSRRIVCPTQKRCSCQYPCTCQQPVPPMRRPCAQEQYYLPGGSSRRPCSSCAPYVGELVNLSTY